MRFQKGNKLAKGGARMGAGRKKSPQSQVTEAMDNLREQIPALLKNLIDQGLAGDTKAAMYCVDRIMGKPVQVDLTGELEATERLKYYAELLRGVPLEVKELSTAIDGEIMSPLSTEEVSRQELESGKINQCRNT